MLPELQRGELPVQAAKQGLLVMTGVASGIQEAPVRTPVRVSASGTLRQSRASARERKRDASRPFWRAGKGTCRGSPSETYRLSGLRASSRIQ